MAEPELSDLQYRDLLEEIRRQPLWRKDADRADDYYHGRQLDSATAEELQAKGLAPIICNLIKPTVNAVLGMEAKNRTDWRVEADSEEHQDVAEALSEKLYEAERETRADDAMGRAYFDQVSGGVGWCYISRNSDPFGYGYKVEQIPRNEIWWDWSARKPDLSDARYLVRERWYPVEQLVAYMPDKERLLRATATNWAPEWMDLAQSDETLLKGFNDETNRRNWMDEDWRRMEDGLLKVREVWYRVYRRGRVIKLPDGRKVEYDKTSDVHNAAVVLGEAQVTESVFTTLRVALYVGPHKLEDTDAGTRDLPYVPFWGYREGNGVPYGIIRDMIPMQDEVNARRRKLMWLLSSKRVVVDSDALDRKYNDFSDLADEVARPDALIVTNPGRANANGVRIETDLQLASQQYDVMQEAQDGIQKVSGIYNAMMGRDEKAMSGTAISSLVEQGTISIADVNDNYMFARTLVGERLKRLVAEDLTDHTVVMVEGEQGGRKKIELNKPALDPMTGMQYKENDVTKALIKVALADVPSTSAYRAQAMTMMAEVLKGLPPELQAPLMPYFLETTDLPKRKEMADTLRKALGLATGEDGEDAPDPEKQQMMQALQEMQAQMQQMGVALEDKQAEDAKRAAETAKLQAQTQQIRADVARTAMEGSTGMEQVA